jgi:hypothetical protein
VAAPTKGHAALRQASTVPLAIGASSSFLMFLGAVSDPRGTVGVLVPDPFSRETDDLCVSSAPANSRQAQQNFAAQLILSFNLGT